MHVNSVTAAAAIGFLLDLAEPGDSRTAQQRIAYQEPPAEGLLRRWGQTGISRSVLLWVLEEDDPELNARVWRHPSADDSMRRAILRGTAHGPGEGPVRLSPSLDGMPEPPVPPELEHLGPLEALRGARSMGTARAAASLVAGHADWQDVIVADRQEPLPGYARWALSIRADCPKSLRAQFGSHRKFDHRLEQARIVGSPAEYALDWTPAAHVLEVLFLGRTLFPHRVGEAADALRPLVREHLGDRPEAWAVLAQLIDTYRGTPSELLATAGAIA
ncbi:hypothetical protein [Streptomyces sp. NBC_01465]|uniref:hypothetical protein n=1 Tax=Streptomyces sp. NBC_01465 TaxID=2903878 RepID=UPI002E32E9B5|nr:hypothetical protein [Streptomyces sp. NBC_01465]